MLDFSNLNWVAIIAAYLFNSILGFLWYSEATPIGKFYMKEMGYTSEDMSPNPLHFGLDFFFRFLIIVGLAEIIIISGVSTFFDGVLVGLFVWAIFLVGAQWAQVAFEKRKLSIWGLYAAFQLITFSIFGGVFAIWT